MSCRIFQYCTCSSHNCFMELLNLHICKEKDQQFLIKGNKLKWSFLEFNLVMLKIFFTKGNKNPIKEDTLLKTLKHINKTYSFSIQPIHISLGKFSLEFQFLSFGRLQSITTKYTSIMDRSDASIHNICHV